MLDRLQVRLQAIPQKTVLEWGSLRRLCTGCALPPQAKRRRTRASPLVHHSMMSS